MLYADTLDLSAARAQAEIDRAIVEIQKKAQYSIIGTGTCECCKAIVEPVWINNQTEKVVGRWCSVECRDHVED